MRMARTTNRTRMQLSTTSTLRRPAATLRWRTLMAPAISIITASSSMTAIADDCGVLISRPQPGTRLRMDHGSGIRNGAIPGYRLIHGAGLLITTAGGRTAQITDGAGVLMERGEGLGVRRSLSLERSSRGTVRPIRPVRRDWAARL